MMHGDLSIQNEAGNSIEQEQLRRSTRTRRTPTFLEDYHHQLMISPCEEKLKEKVRYPLDSIMSYKSLSEKQLKYTLFISSKTKPKCYEEEKCYPEWMEAMRAEIEALEVNKTWDIVDLPHNKIPIGCKWGYKVKHKADGKIERYKARLVAKGYTQREGINYMDTYSPVARLTTIRTILVVAAVMDWHLEQLDVNNAFLHGDLQEEVYMSLPPGITTVKSNQVSKLIKALYGLKQASKQWYDKLSSFLYNINFVQSRVDNSLFIRKSETSFIALLIYVNDILIARNDIEDIDIVKNSLNSAFKIKDLGHLNFFLGLEIARTHKGKHICQRKYALDILTDVGMLGVKPANTTMTQKNDKLIYQSFPVHNITLYRRIIGRLLYLVNTRPDISFFVQFLSQFC